MANGFKREDLNNAIIKLYKEGKNVDQIGAYLTSIGRSKLIRNDIYEANKKIALMAQLERETLINTHVKRYEKLYDEHIKKTLKDFEYLPAHMRRYALVDTYVIALDALVAKERVLGLHTRAFRIQLNNFFKKKTIAKYNFNQIELNDLIRLDFLLAKMRLNVEESVIYFDDLAEETKVAAAQTHDVDYVEINDQIISKIKEENKLPLLQQKEEQKLISLDNITDKILKADLNKSNTKRNNLLKQLKELKK